MKNNIITIIVGVLLLLGLIVCLFYWFSHTKKIKYLLDNFSKSNVYVYGRKGTGKDLTFQYVINKRKEHYYSNITYGYKHHNLKLIDLNLDPNTYENFVNDNLVKSKRKFKSKCDFYISESGLLLPSHLDSLLDKKYKSLPIFFGLSRHLYEANIHINSQALCRTWKKLREQCDFFVHTIKTTKIFFLPFLFVSVVSYEKYETAEKEMLPLKQRRFNKDSKANVDLYNATYGLITPMTLIIPTWTIKYDTRYFSRKLLKGKDRYYK